MKVRARLYNGNMNLMQNIVRRDASIYGFEGLIVVPVVESGQQMIGETELGYASAKVTEDMVEAWGVTADEVIDAAIDSIDYTIETVKQALIETMGMDDIPREILDAMIPDAPMLVVSNPTKYYGASSIIPATKELINRFPNGFRVLPSSVHEVLVVPMEDGGDSKNLNEIVNQVNANVLKASDFLSNDVYEFTE